MKLLYVTVLTVCFLSLLSWFIYFSFHSFSLGFTVGFNIVFVSWWVKTCTTNPHYGAKIVKESCQCVAFPSLSCKDLFFLCKRKKKENIKKELLWNTGQVKTKGNKTSSPVILYLFNIFFLHYVFNIVFCIIQLQNIKLLVDQRFRTD